MEVAFFFFFVVVVVKWASHFPVQVYNPKMDVAFKIVVVFEFVTYSTSLNDVERQLLPGGFFSVVS